MLCYKLLIPCLLENKNTHDDDDENMDINNNKINVINSHYPNICPPFNSPIIFKDIATTNPKVITKKTKQ